ncbi:MAG: phosphoribosylglycinamide formyltransferase [Magnetococcales bacterium]|nr:phosphoribosylglycinamide formyltransferase [Magnetococcales bacterium]
MTESSFRYGVLISGSGSNLQALIDRSADGTIPGRIALVISNEPDAFGLQRAEKAAIPTRVIDHRAFPNRTAFEKAMADALDAAQVDLVCLAGFMRVLTPWFVRHYQGRLLNIHPALLPAFPGLHVQQKALDTGVRFSGATVHFVVEDVDAGPIVVQAVVPVHPEDDAPALSARILQQEHRIFPLAVRLFAQKRLKVQGRRVIILNHVSDPSVAVINPESDLVT